MSEKPKRPDRLPKLRDLVGFAGLFTAATAIWLAVIVALGIGMFVGVLLKEILRH